MALENTARSVNAWRVFPRLFSIWFGYIATIVAQWYMDLVDPTVEQSGFAGVVITAAAAWFKFYVESGNAKAD